MSKGLEGRTVLNGKVLRFGSFSNTAYLKVAQGIRFEGPFEGDNHDLTNLYPGTPRGSKIRVSKVAQRCCISNPGQRNTKA